MSSSPNLTPDSSLNTSEAKAPGEIQASGSTANVADLSSGLQKRLEESEKLNAELQKQVTEEKNRYLYLYADFDNYKKRAIKERSDAIKFGWEPCAKELLQVIDNLERALEHMAPTTDKTLVQGLHMVLNQFEAVLEKQGVKEVDTLQQVFDPNLHEAVGQEASDHPSGTVIKEHTTGYTLHGRLLRPARVVISGGKS